MSIDIFIETLPFLCYILIIMKSFKNKEELLKYGDCGCYYCISQYKVEEITDYIDNGQTAVCPKCGIDSVLPKESEDFEDVLYKQHVHSFCWGSRGEDDELKWYPTSGYKSVIVSIYGNKLYKYRSPNE